LLEGQIDRIAGGGLAHPEQAPSLPHAGTDVDINWVRLSHEY
jgi:hypothetical protein